MSKLKKYRMISGLSQGKLAEAAGIDVMKISRIERGLAKEENLSLRVAFQLANALNICTEDLLPDEYKTISELSQSHEDMKESHEADAKPSLTPEQLQEIAMKAVQDALANVSK